MFLDSACERCLCDPTGVEGGVCDASGECFCKNNLDVFKLHNVDCVSCDCDPVGAMASACSEESGACVCRANVEGRRCDQCQEGYAGLDEQGCKAATELEFSFLLLGTSYQSAYSSLASSSSAQLASSLSSQLERELYQFGLSGLFQVIVTALTDSGVSDQVLVRSKVASYMPADSAHLSRPSKSELAEVVQIVLQSGRIGDYRVNVSSGLCSQLPGMCTECPEGLVLDGLICRQATLCPGVEVGGADVDRDGVPDSCDTCPYVFNPNQSSTPCELREGVCPGVKEAGVLWSATSADFADRKPCPPPYIGVSIRQCGLNASWERVNLIGCVSLVGQSLLEQIQLLEGGQVFSPEELRGVADTLVLSSAYATAPQTGGDIRVAGKLLNQLILQASTMLPAVSSDEEQGAGLQDTVDSLATVASNLLNPDLKASWMGVVEGVEFDAEDLLFSLEDFARVRSLALLNQSRFRDELREQNFLLVTQPLLSLNITQESSDSFMLAFNDSTATVSLLSATPLLTATFGLFPTLGSLLPVMATFNISQLELATPILSVQTADSQGSEFTRAVVNLSMSLTREVVREELVQEALCVSWRRRDGWTVEGCGLLETTVTSVTCHCSHLTAFAVFVPSQAYEPLPPVPIQYRPSLFLYATLAVSCVLLLVSFLLLMWVGTVQGLSDTVSRNLMLSLLLTLAVFIAAIDRTELKVVCGAVGVVITVVLLIPVCWMLADILLLARFLVQPPPKANFVACLYIIGWGMPLVLSALSLGSYAAVRRDDFLEIFAYPEYCWLKSEVVWAYAAPLLFVTTVYLIVLLFCVAALCHFMAHKDKEMNTRKIRTVLFTSVTTVSLYLVGVAAAILCLYVERYVEYMLGVLSVILAVFLFSVHCLNKNVRQAVRNKWQQNRKMAENSLSLGVLPKTRPLPPTPPPSPPPLQRLPTLRKMASEAHGEFQPHPSLRKVVSNSPGEFRQPSSLRGVGSPPNDYKHRPSLCKTVSSTPSEFQRQLAMLSHQPIHQSPNIPHRPAIPPPEHFDLPPPPEFIPSPPPQEHLPPPPSHTSSSPDFLPPPPSMDGLYPPSSKMCAPSSPKEAPWFSNPTPLSPLSSSSELSRSDFLAQASEVSADGASMDQEQNSTIRTSDIDDPLPEETEHPYSNYREARDQEMAAAEAWESKVEGSSLGEFDGVEEKETLSVEGPPAAFERHNHGNGKVEGHQDVEQQHVHNILLHQQNWTPKMQLPEEYLEYTSKEEGVVLKETTPKAQEDPMWYKQRDSFMAVDADEGAGLRVESAGSDRHGSTTNQFLPLPYESAVKPHLPSSRSPRGTHTLPSLKTRPLPPSSSELMANRPLPPSPEWWITASSSDLPQRPQHRATMGSLGVIGDSSQLSGKTQTPQLHKQGGSTVWGTHSSSNGGVIETLGASATLPKSPQRRGNVSSVMGGEQAWAYGRKLRKYHSVSDQVSPNQDGPESLV